MEDTNAKPKKKVIKKAKYSRLGCFNCKKRRVKCGEELDQCLNCLSKHQRCSYLDLTEDQKQKIRNNYTQSSTEGSQQLQDPSRRVDFYSEINDSKFDINVPRGLPNCTLEDTVMPLIKVHYNKLPIEEEEDMCFERVFKVCGEDNYYYSSIRLILTFWFNNFYISASRSSMLYDASISRSVFIVLANREKNCYSTHNTAQKETFLKNIFFPHHLKGLKKAQLTIDLLSDTEKLNEYLYDFLEQRRAKNTDPVEWLSQQILDIKLDKDTDRYSPESMSSPQSFKNALFLQNIDSEAFHYAYLTFFKNLIHYSLINVGLTLQSEKPYTSLTAFLNGFLSSTLHTDSFVNSSSVFLQEKYANSDLQAEIIYTMKMSNYSRSFFINTRPYMYIRTYPLDILFELFGRLDLFMSKFEGRTSVAFLQFNDLKRFLKDIVENDVLSNGSNANTVSGFDMDTVYRLLIRFFEIFPSEAAFFGSVYKQFDPVDGISYFFWLAVAHVLDNIFPATSYLFATKFSSGLPWAGYDIKTPEYYIKQLKVIFKLVDFELYDYLMRELIYLVRITSFFSHRLKNFFRNIQIYNPFPWSKERDKEFRFISRCPDFIKETYLTNTRNIAIGKEHYPVADINMSSICDPEHPSHTSNVGFLNFVDKNYSIDENFDLVQSYILIYGFDLDSIPLEYLKLSEWGLLLNIDYRPNLAIGPSETLKPKANDSQETLKQVIADYIVDKDCIINCRAYGYENIG